MSKQSDALRLADELADYTGFTVVGMDQAAAELRRLYELNIDKTEIIASLSATNQKLLSTAELALEALEMAQDHWTTYHGLRSRTIDDSIDALRAVIDKVA
jgi:hypothetical protein